MEQQTQSGTEVQTKKGKTTYHAFVVSKMGTSTAIVTGHSRSELKQKVADLTDWNIVGVVRGKLMQIQEKRALSFG